MSVLTDVLFGSTSSGYGSSVNSSEFSRLSQCSLGSTPFLNDCPTNCMSTTCSKLTSPDSIDSNYSTFNGYISDQVWNNYSDELPYQSTQKNSIDINNCDGRLKKPHQIISQDLLSKVMNSSHTRTIPHLERSLSNETIENYHKTRQQNFASSFITFQVQIQPDLNGFGCVISKDASKSRFTVKYVSADGPAAKSGLKVNDRIVAVNEHDVRLFAKDDEFTSVFKKTFINYCNQLYQLNTTTNYPSNMPHTLNSTSTKAMSNSIHEVSTHLKLLLQRPIVT